MAKKDLANRLAEKLAKLEKEMIERKEGRSRELKESEKAKVCDYGFR